MGDRGPLPKREEERRRRNKPETETTAVVVGDDSDVKPVVVPEPEEHWLPMVRELWDSFMPEVSATSLLLEPTDWALLKIGLEDLNREMKPRKVQIGVDGGGDPIFIEAEMPMPGGKFVALQKLMANLLATEGDRRRLSIEVKRHQAKAAGNASLPKDQVAAQRKKRLG